MTMAANIANTVKLFQEYWRAGTDARLHLECHAGKVWMNLEVHLTCPPPPPPPSQHGSQRPRQSPSRLRRRARRAEARAAAKAAATEATENAAVRKEDDRDTDSTAATLPNDIPPPLPANIGVHQHHQAAGEVAGLAVVPDIFCPDTVYHSVPPPPCQDSLPQLDGHAAEEEEQGEQEDDWINPNPVTGSWVCRCCYYAHNFKNEDDLKKHHDTLSIEYAECNICYPWHVWS